MEDSRISLLWMREPLELLDTTKNGKSCMAIRCNTPVFVVKGQKPVKGLLVISQEPFSLFSFVQFMWGKVYSIESEC
jgi:hypothetical protein